jgi:hypothetical protein
MSQSRHCLIYRATDGLWYLELGNFEYHYDEEQGPFSVYGGFSSVDGAEQELQRHSNPGCLETDDSGSRAPPPPVAPNPLRRYRRLGHH